MKTFSKLFIYISLLFLVIFLIRQDYLFWPEIRSYTSLIGSVILLFLGFIGQAWQWQQIIQIHGHPIRYKDAFISTGLSIFGKYIPGKVWLIVGRASYINVRYKIDMTSLSYYSLISQVIFLWLGLILGSLCLLSPGNTGDRLNLISLIGFCLLSLVLFVPQLSRVLSRIIKKVTKKEILIPTLKFQVLIRTFPVYLFTWLAWSVGFYLMVNSIYEVPFGFTMISIFPFAATMGILAILVPGGIGVREGIMVLLLNQFLGNNDLGVSIASFQRLWFLLGELMIFLVAFGWNSWKLIPNKIE